jgi:hypothetical protein
MSREAKEPSLDERAAQAQIAAEWANVGLCGGMYRPAGKPGEKRAEDRAHVKESEWQPNGRCCS